MPKTVSLFRVFVASPGDCEQERRIAQQVIASWNITPGFSHGVMLEAVLWESHAHPAYGTRPQDAINNQILDLCDVLVAVFKTRLGSATNVGISGTVEEIERFHASGKPVLLYFSESIKSKTTNTHQAAALAAFKSTMKEKGLFCTYRGIHEFQTKLSIHIGLSMAKISSILPFESLPAYPQTVDSRAVPFTREMEVGAPDLCNPKSALRHIRDNTKYLWRDLKDANTWEQETRSELRESTFEKIQPALKILSVEGYLQFKVTDGYRLDSEDSLTWQSYEDPVVLSITISAMTKELAALILEV
ncbi:MAG: DUF4062 domain-containing protein, partial [Nitrosospira sp.]